MLASHLYLHVPFCSRRCSYCDFAIAVRRNVPVNEYVNAIKTELHTRRIKEQVGALKTVYLGGGTPSRLGAEGIKQLMFAVKEIASIESNAEVTLEANPEDITEQAVHEWASSGVNRLSIGIQSFNNRVLQWMHRVHTAEDALEAANRARKGGINAISLDLIFAVPEMLHRNWEEDIATVASLEPDHISLYGLTVEKGTPLGKWTERGEVSEANEERYEQDFLFAHQFLVNAGYEHYEVSNFARPGKRAVHNSAYWKHVPYIGVGPSAHGFDGTKRRWNTRHYTDWLAAISAKVDPIEGDELLTHENLQAETVYLGLRTVDGLEVTSGDQAESERVSEFIRNKWLETIADDRSERVRCTPSGWLRLDTLAADLTAIRSRS